MGVFSASRGAARRVVFGGIKAMRATFSPFDPRTRGLNDLLVRVQAARKQDGDAKVCQALP